MLTQQEDQLTQFEKKIAKPKSFYLVLGIFIATILLYFFIFRDRLMYMLSVGDPDIIYYFMIFFLYPFIGTACYRIGKKAGWFILSHFCFSSLLLMSGILAVDLFGQNSAWGDSSILSMIGIFILSLMAVFFLFRYYFTDYFGLTRTAILGVIILTVIVPVVLGLLAAFIF